MSTLVVLSDLHIGPSHPGFEHRFFRGETALEPALRALAEAHGKDLHLVLNGDTLDFLMATGVVRFDQDTALAGLELILQGGDGQALVRGLRAVTGAGGRVTIRLGNHDPELRNGQVRKRVEAEVPGLEWDDAPITRYVLRGVPVLVEHGETTDDFNKFEYGTAGTKAFGYPPGSSLVVNLLQTVRVEEQLGFLDALKPDFKGALLAGLLLRPGAVRHLVGWGALDVVARLTWWKLRGPLGLVDGDDDALDEVYRALDAVGSRPHGTIDLDEAVPEPDPRDPSGARIRALFSRVAPWIRSAAREDGADFFDLTPRAKELDDVYPSFEAGSSVVIRGHSHAARFWTDGTRAYVNTGTWGALMRLPGPQASDADWTDFYLRLRADPSLTPENTYTFFAACRVREAEAGLGVELLRWDGARWVLAGETRTGVELRPGPARPQALLDVPESIQAGAVEAELEHLERAVPTRAAVPRFVRAALATQARKELDRKAVRTAAALLDLHRQLDEQRRNPAHLDVLHAADAIARALHDAVLGRAATSDSTPPPLPPVAWLESVASPVTWNRQQGVPAPGLLNRGQMNLPFPVVIVPTDHLDRPWRLLSVLHEVGHNLDHHFRLADDLRLGLAARPPWSGWAEEIVADLIAVRTAGHAYVRVLEWIIRGTRAGQLPRRSTPEYPPSVLRLALLEQALGADGPHTRRWREDAPQGEAGRVDEFAEFWASDAAAGLRAYTEGPASALITAVVEHCPEAELEPEPSPELRHALRARLAALPHPDDGLTAAHQAFLQGQHTRFAPTSIDATGSLVKLPRADLMLDTDHMWFVGATQENLLPALRLARAQRGRPWRSIELFFLGNDVDLPTLYPGDTRDLPGVRAHARDRLHDALRTEDLAERWRIHLPAPGLFFASFYLKRDPGYPDVWYAHTSAPVWGQGIRGAPSTDYQSVSSDLRGDPELQVLLAGLDHLRSGPVDVEGGTGEWVVLRPGITGPVSARARP